MVFLETICCDQGQLLNLAEHQQRVQRTLYQFYGQQTQIDLVKQVRVPKQYQQGRYRCRVLYRQCIEQVEFIKQVSRPVHTLQIVRSETIDYRFKYADRSALMQLYQQRGTCDDILIVRQGYLTDSSIANLVLFNAGRWWTPDTPLLPGTQRAKLIREGKIIPATIRLPQLSDYKQVGLINALHDLQNMPILSVDQIYPAVDAFIP